MSAGAATARAPGGTRGSGGRDRASPPAAAVIVFHAARGGAELGVAEALAQAIAVGDDVRFFEVDATPPGRRPSAASVLAVLAGAAARGLGCALRGGFTRRMFGVRQELALRPRRIIQLAIVVAAVGTATLAAALAWLLLAARVLSLLTPGAGAGAAAVELAFAWSLSALALLAVAGLGAARGREGDVARRPSAAVRTMSGVLAAAGLALIALVAAAAAAGWTRASFPGAPLVMPLLAVGVIALARLLPRALGDVASYVGAPHVRAELRRRAREAACAVYGARAPGGDRPAFDAVIVVGHGLGSAMAFDLLDDALARHGECASASGVVSRTRLLLTLGSPLDKLAVVLHDRADDGAGDASTPPAGSMLSRYADRPARWVNLWTPFDWMSGSLEYFDEHPIRAEHALRAVENVRDDAAPWNPVRAHHGYWRRRALRELLHVELDVARRIVS